MSARDKGRRAKNALPAINHAKRAARTSEPEARGRKLFLTNKLPLTGAACFNLRANGDKCARRKRRTRANAPLGADRPAGRRSARASAARVRAGRVVVAGSSLARWGRSQRRRQVASYWPRESRPKGKRKCKCATRSVLRNWMRRASHSPDQSLARAEPALGQPERTAAGASLSRAANPRAATPAAADKRAQTTAGQKSGGK